MNRKYLKSEGDEVLTAFANETGGRAFFPYHVEDVSESFLDIGTELRSQYSLAYSPTNGIVDGKYRKIQIEVVGRKGLDVRTRKGYYAVPPIVSTLVPGEGQSNQDRSKPASGFKLHGKFGRKVRICRSRFANFPARSIPCGSAPCRLYPSLPRESCGMSRRACRCRVVAKHVFAAQFVGNLIERFLHFLLAVHVDHAPTRFTRKLARTAAIRAIARIVYEQHVYHSVGALRGFNGFSQREFAAVIFRIRQDHRALSRPVSVAILSWQARYTAS